MSAATGLTRASGASDPGGALFQQRCAFVMAATLRAEGPTTRSKLVITETTALNPGREKWTP